MQNEELPAVLQFSCSVHFGEVELDMKAKVYKTKQIRSGFFILQFGDHFFVISVFFLSVQLFNKISIKPVVALLVIF